MAMNCHHPTAPLPRLMLVALFAFLPTGCAKSRDEIFASPLENQTEPAAQTLPLDLKELAKSKHPEDAKADSDYEKAKERLIRRGSSIESRLIEVLLGDEDWGMRLGAVEVIQSIGTKRSVAPLIQVLDDPQPLVALYAEHSLRAMTKHQEIPETDKPPGANGLPPVPVPDANDLSTDAELRLWSTWHAQHKTQLKKSWSEWWDKNKEKTKVD